MDIKQSLECLDAVELIAVKGIEIAEGGLGADDLPKVLELIQQHQIIIAGVQGADEVPAELKELSQEELIQLGMKAVKMVGSIKAALKK